MTTLLSVGYPQTMTQNQVFALPATRCLLFTETVAATIVQSNDVAMGTTAPVTLPATGMAEVSGGFIKCTSGNIVVTLKKN